MEMEAWEQLKNIDIRKADLADIAGLADITELEMSGAELDMQTFIQKIKNPYCFMAGDVIVKSTFLGEASLQQRMQELAEGL